MNRSRSAFPPDGYSSPPTCSQDVLSDSLVVDTLPPPAATGNDNAGTRARCCPSCGAVDRRAVSPRRRPVSRDVALADFTPPGNTLLMTSILSRPSPFGRCLGCSTRMGPGESHRRYCTSCGPKFDTLPPPPSVPLLHGTRR